jgi:CIC family chloride channel protein
VSRFKEITSMNWLREAIGGLDDDLNTALKRFTELNLDELPVLASDDSRRLLGMLRRKDAIAIYNRRIAERKLEALEHG